MDVRSPSPDEQVDSLRRDAVGSSRPTSARRRRRAARRLAALRTPEAAHGLAEVLIATTNYQVRDIATQALTALTDQEARDAVCEVAIATGDDRLWKLISQAGHLPSGPERLALWLLLDGQFDRAAELDFDGGLLRAARRTAGATLRRRIAEQVRASGRIQWVPAVVEEADRHRLEDRTEEEWETTLRVLGAERRWGELWRLAPGAPLPWAARLLNTLEHHGWQPDATDDLDGYHHLRPLAARCTTPPTAASLFQEARVLARGTLAPREERARLVAVNGPGTVLARIEYPASHQDGDLAGSLWHLPSGDPAGGFPVRDRPCGLAVSPDGRTVAVGYHNGEVWIEGLATGGQPVERNDLDTRPYQELAFTPDGEQLVGATKAAVLRAWRVPSGQPMWWVALTWSSRPTPPHLLVPNGPFVGARATRPGSPRDRHRLRLIYRWTGWVTRLIRSDEELMAQDGRRLLTVRRGGGRDEAVLRELPTMTRLTTWSVSPRSGPWLVSPDGVWFVCGDGDDVEIRRARDSHLVNRFANPIGVPPTAISRDRRLFAGTGDGIALGRLPSGEPAGSLALDAGTIGLLAFTAGDALVAWTEDPGGHGDLVTLWRPEPVLMGQVPVAGVTPEEADRLRRRIRHGDDRTWGELLAALVRLRHRYDVDLRDGGTGTPAATDIEATG